MRIGERGSTQVRAEAPPAGRFSDALRRAREAGPHLRGGRGAARAEAARPAARTSAARDAPADERSILPSGPPSLPLAAVRDDPATPELAALARTLPVAIAAAGARPCGALALSFGRSLDVELRAGAAGVELLLRAEPRLARIAEAELPGLLAAMRVRGVAVARAEVRPRGAAARRSR